MPRHVEAIALVLLAACSDPAGPTAVEDIVFTRVSTGMNHTCGISTAGVAYCWGDNEFGELGTDDWDSFGTVRPTRVPFEGELVDISTGRIATCALTRQGAAFCWGYNGFGQLGNGGQANATQPTAVAGGLTFKSVQVGQYHACGLTTAGKAYCWGSNFNGAAGTDADDQVYLVPTPVAGQNVFASIVVGEEVTCALDMDGAVFCWGVNPYGQIGDGTTTTRFRPTAVGGGLFFTSLTGSRTHHCALTAAGAAYCWGNNNSGQLGDGTLTSRSIPTSAGGLQFTMLSAGNYHTCGLIADGTAYCWGSNTYGEIGRGTPDFEASNPDPAPISSALRFGFIHSGLWRTCGIALDDESYCWGSNAFGSLGNGSIENSIVPQRVDP